MLRCSKEAFNQCPTSHLCGRREDATYMEGSECDRFNQEVANRPMMEQVFIRARILGELPSGQKLVGLLANNADGIRFYTEERCLVRFPAPVTNADHIRAMNNYQLAVLFAKTKAQLSRLDSYVIAYSGDEVVENLKWLRQPADSSDEDDRDSGLVEDE